MSAVFEIEMGVTMVAEAEAVAVAWAEAVLEEVEAKKMVRAAAERRRNLFMTKRERCERE
jgi:hypothetical protein